MHRRGIKFHAEEAFYLPKFIIILLTNLGHPAMQAAAAIFRPLYPPTPIMPYFDRNLKPCGGQLGSP
jgi:hypothetical protein